MTDNLNNYEVLIAGAGPSGCASAIVLASAGIRVAIIDEVNEAFKIGESLPSAAIRMLRRLGINQLEEILDADQYASCAANVSSWGNDKWEYVDALHNPEGGGWHLVRSSFDQALRQKASSSGVSFFNGKIGKIKSANSESRQHIISFKDRKETLPEYLESQWLIDATGRSSVIIKQFGVGRTSHQDQLAAMCWLKPISNSRDQTTRIKSVENGWLYSARLPDGYRVLAFYGLPDQVADMIRNPELFFQTVNQTDLLKDDIDQSNLASALQATKAGLSKANSVIGKNWIAVGDAALALDPLSSQGIFFSLYSGIRGAETILKTNESPQNHQNIALQFKHKIDQVYEANQKSRRYHYTSELRYVSHPFWKRWF